jgi:hypothetical protein
MLDTEFGGMNEVLTSLFQLTGDPAHLTTAQDFDHAEIFDPLAANQDRLAGYHNGAVQDVATTPGTYATISRSWASARHRRADPADDAGPRVHSGQRHRAGVKYGRIVLSGGMTAARTLSSLPVLDPAPIQPMSTPLRFSASASTGAVMLLPFYQMRGQRYAVYRTVR